MKTHDDIGPEEPKEQAGHVEEANKFNTVLSLSIMAGSETFFVPSKVFLSAVTGGLSSLSDFSSLLSDSFAVHLIPQAANQSRLVSHDQSWHRPFLPSFCM